MHQKLDPDSFYFLIQPKLPLHARNSCKNKIFWKGIIKKLTLFFLSNPVPFNGQSYKKQKRLETSDQFLFSWKNKLKKFFLLVIYYQTKFDGVIQRGSSVIPKLTPANLCNPIHGIINYSTSICSVESGTCGKAEEKLQKLEYLKNEKIFLDEIKKHFSKFLKGYHLVKK